MLDWRGPSGSAIPLAAYFSNTVKGRVEAQGQQPELNHTIIETPLGLVRVRPVVRKSGGSNRGMHWAM